MAKSRLITDRTPAEMGYTFPAEWEPQSGTWFSWPRPEGISFPDRYHTIPASFAAMFRAITPRQLVHVNVPNSNYERIVRETLREHGVNTRRVRFHHVPTNESWCRDHGPAFVVRERRGRREMAVVDWEFNAWGGKYPPYDADNAVPAKIAEELGLPRFRPGIVMEGGAIDVNGRGCLLTTESCLLNPNRNPGRSRADIERFLREFLGTRQVIWLGEGIAGDDTDGHVDDITRFVAPDTIVTVVEEDPSDPNHAPLADNLRRLQHARDAAGRPYRIVTLPMPGPVVDDQSERLPASYANFYIANDVVLLPVYGHPNDQRAVETLAPLFPRRRVVPIDCEPLVWGMGSIHCVTQQQPR